ncbi:MAG: hypothetical protein RIS41_2187 [Actinomycetota bacterium]|jgi:alkylation response protein AidB-like acyl-CoA dehydrogenase
MSTATDETLSPAEAEAFRAKVREFLSQNATGSERGVNSIATGREFQQKLAAAGLAGLTYAAEYGGAGLTKAHERIYREEYANFPDMTFELVISHGMCLPVLNQFGTEEQKKQFMPDNIAGRTMWCQMFSEPGAGSDVASLQTKAELDGDEWVINGQKVWTTLAHVCEYGVIIARTNPDAPKHAGISMFIIDMKAPGVEIRPIHQIDGGKHFNEIFLTDVRIPKSWLLGELNNGWNQATAMLMFERVAIGTGSTSGVTHTLTDGLIEIAKKNGKIADPVMRQELMKLYSEETTKSLVAMRTRAEMKAGRVPGPGGSLGKLHGSRISWMMRPLISRLIGPETDAWEGSSSRGEAWSKRLLNSFQSGIAGGTDEIQKNIIGDRVLGLPREPMVDKDLPFKDLKVGTQR